MRYLRVVALIMVSVLIVAACSNNQTATTTTSTTTTTTTTSTIAATTTTTLPTRLEEDIVGEKFYSKGVPVYLSDYGYDVFPDRDYLTAVGFNLPPGTEIRAPFDGYLIVDSYDSWSTRLGGFVKKIEVFFSTKGNSNKADTSDMYIKIETTPLNVRIPQVPQGRPTNWVPVRKGEVFGVITETKKKLPLHIKGLKVLISFGHFNPDSGRYRATPEDIWKFFPYVGAGSEVKP